jgi:hypothetical protein
MPLARYILYVGGALLGLLLVSDLYLPKLPAADWEKSRSAIIRIHSDQKWPERIVYDTSLLTVVPPPTANIEANVAAPEIVASTKALEAFAQLKPSSRLSDVKKREPRPQSQRKIAKRSGAPPALLAARQVEVGWFGNRIW